MPHNSFCAVRAVLRTPTGRIVLAFALSVLIHAAILWLPYIQLPHSKVYLPPLTVRLESLPKREVQPATVPEHTIQTSTSGNGPSTRPIAETANTMEEMEKSAALHRFPKHVQLTFAVYRGDSAFSIGEIQQQLDIRRDRYTLTSLKKTVGLTSLLNNDQQILTSHGKIGGQGLQPETFIEEKIIGGGKQSQKATFDWTAQKLHFSHGGEAALSSDAQDMLSFMYQLSQLSMEREIVPLSVSDGINLNKYLIEIGAEEEISTQIGKLRTLHLRKLHAQNEPFFEIWLGLDYRLLPVKFRQVSGAGEVIEEFVLSDIRVADK